MNMTGLFWKMIIVAVLALGPSQGRADALPRVVIIGDSIAKGTGEALCAIIKRQQIPFTCKVSAVEGLSASRVGAMVERGADYLVISAGTNDWARSSDMLGAALADIRSRAGANTRVIWIQPGYPPFAHDLVQSIADTNGDDIVNPDFGFGTFMRTVHPQDYTRTAAAVLAKLMSRARADADPEMDCRTVGLRPQDCP